MRPGHEAGPAPAARAQLRDTCDLFCFKRQRRLSLRFLASYLLGLDIQAGTHDSVEDARTALALFRLYERLAAEGSLPGRLLAMYRWGKAHGWRASPPPPLAPSARPACPAPAASPGRVAGVPACVLLNVQQQPSAYLSWTPEKSICGTSEEHADRRRILTKLLISRLCLLD